MNSKGLVKVEMQERSDLVNGCKIWPIGSGKGGVGKSFITANLGLALAEILSKGEERVVLFDADLGGGNLHTCFGMKNPPFTVQDFISKRKENLSQIMLETPLPNLKLISGTSGVLSVANPRYGDKMRLLNHFNDLEANYLLLDLSAGSSYNTIDFLSLSSEAIVITTPEPAALLASYGFIRNALYRKLMRFLHKQPLILPLIVEAMNRNGRWKVGICGQLIEAIGKVDQEVARQTLDFVINFKVYLILNMVRNRRDINVGEKFRLVTKKYLHCDLCYLGHVVWDERVRKAARRMSPLVFEYPHSTASRCIYLLAQKLLTEGQQGANRKLFQACLEMASEG